jgi:hypothetical protein
VLRFPSRATGAALFPGIHPVQSLLPLHTPTKIRIHKIIRHCLVSAAPKISSKVYSIPGVIIKEQSSPLAQISGPCNPCAAIHNNTADEAATGGFEK